MSNPRPLIHIGYQKTASTWLQQVIFNNNKSGFLMPWGCHAIDQSLEAIEQFVIPDSFHFSAESARKVFQSGLNDAVDRGFVPVLSDETLSGNLLISRPCSNKEIADRIYAVFPEARILIVIREQQSMAMSLYREHIKGGGIVTLPQFIGTGINKKGWRPLLRLERLEYDLLISYYQNLFGKDNVLVLPFELLKKQPQIFTQRIFSFAESNGIANYSDTAKRVGFKGAKLAFQRQINSWRRRPRPRTQTPLVWILTCKLSAGLARLVPPAIDENIEKRLQQFIVERIGDSFHESNQRTSNLIGINLADFGYK